jgi:hypothetical protein
MGVDVVAGIGGPRYLIHHEQVSDQE